MTETTWWKCVIDISDDVGRVEFVEYYVQLEVDALDRDVEGLTGYLASWNGKTGAALKEYVQQSPALALAKLAEAAASEGAIHHHQGWCNAPVESIESIQQLNPLAHGLNEVWSDQGLSVWTKKSPGHRLS